MRISDWSSDVCSSDLGACTIWQYVVGDDPVRARRHDGARGKRRGHRDRLWPRTRRRGNPVRGMNPFASLRTPIEREEEMDAAELPPERYARVLADLSRINALTLAQRPTLGFLDRLRARGVGDRPWRILDRK